jgi:uncharacterized protein (TIGR00255 family)
MTRSMTAFSRVSSEGEWGSLTIEIRSVNHRYLDVSLRLPECLREFEAGIRDIIGKHLNRGKLDFYLKFSPGPQLAEQFQLNTDLLDKLVSVSQLVESKVNGAVPLDVASIIKWPELLRVKHPDMKSIQGELLQMVERGVKELLLARESEGEKLQKFLLERVGLVQQQVEALKPLLPDLIGEQRKKLLQRASEAGVSFDQERLEQELVLYAQRIDVQEELDRLLVHLDEVGNILQSDGAVGRRLDFFMQELNREANTLGAKSVAIASSHTSVELKVLVEQMREQIQNIE